LASEDHKSVTQGFIKDFFGVVVELDNIHIVNPYSIHAYQEATKDGGTYQVLRETLRDTTFDLRVADMTVEMQLRPQSTFPLRGFMYMEDLFRQGYDKVGYQRAGDRYGGLRPVWRVDIVGGTLVPDGEPFRMLEPWDRLREVGLTTEVFRWAILELGKAGAPPELARWRDFLLTGAVAADDPAYLREAATIIDHANMSQEERDMISIEEKAEADYQSDLYYAEKRGRGEGREQGIQQGAFDAKLDDARAALQLHLTHDQVMAITGLDAGTVDRLADELGLTVA